MVDHWAEWGVNAGRGQSQSVRALTIVSQCRHRNVQNTEEPRNSGISGHPFFRNFLQAQN